MIRCIMSYCIKDVRFKSRTNLQLVHYGNAIALPIVVVASIAASAATAARASFISSAKSSVAPLPASESGNIMRATSTYLYN